MIPTTELTPVEYGLGKMLACFLFSWALALALTGCGMKMPGGFVAGTTGFLQEANRGSEPMDEYRPSEKEALNKELRRL